MTSDFSQQFSVGEIVVSKRVGKRSQFTGTVRRVFINGKGHRRYDIADGKGRLWQRTKFEISRLTD